MRGAARILGRGAALIVLVAGGGALLLGVVVPRLAGATPYVVMTDSMTPALSVGTLVVVRPTEPEDIGTGDVITYQLQSGERAVVTHRVVGVGTSVGGEPSFVTRGDANEAADPHPVRAVQVHGTLWYAVPWLGHLSSIVSGQQRESVGTVLAVALIGYAGFLVVAEYRARRTKDEGS